ncbi:MAG: DUF362 domain-containing protein [Candidatus Omnitrophica bacterium]|nr:DUF362 domain-containing protein [Candidatus Omnitrophota bacterium]
MQKKITRRTFLKKCLWISALTTIHIITSKTRGLFGEALPDYEGTAGDIPDLVGITGGKPVAMFEKGIEAFGGMSYFIKKGETVVVKPNIGWDKTPEEGANTDPDLVGAIVRHCVGCGAKKVWVFDHTCNNWKACYENSGIKQAVEDNGGMMVPAHAEQYYGRVTVPHSDVIRQALVHETLLEADRFINVPVLKHHGSARVTISMKNLMGVVYDRGYFHTTGLHECIADFAALRKPDVVIVDAYRVMLKNGPRGVSPNDIAYKRMQVISTDMVAADAAGAKIFGVEPETIPHIARAHQKGVGRMDLDNLRIQRIKMAG